MPVVALHGTIVCVSLRASAVLPSRRDDLRSLCITPGTQRIQRSSPKLDADRPTTGHVTHWRPQTNSLGNKDPEPMSSARRTGGLQMVTRYCLNHLPLLFPPPPPPPLESYWLHPLHQSTGGFRSWRKRRNLRKSRLCVTSGHLSL